MTKTQTGTLLRVLNNNAVMVDSAGDRVILLGRGIGFGKRLGDAVDLGAATESFSPSTALELRQLADFAREIPLEVFRVARRAVDHAETVGDVRPSQALLLSVADHLHFAVVRAQTGLRVDFPLQWEIAQLYPRETELGHATVRFANEELGVDSSIDADEATAFAMHFVNAQFAKSDTSQTVAMTKTLQSVVDVVTETLGADATADPTNVARFVTHLRYLYARMTTRTQLSSAPPQLFTAIRDSYPEIVATSARVRGIIDAQGGALSEAEVCYLELHLARLSPSGREPPAAPTPEGETTDGSAPPSSGVPDAS